MKATFRTLAVLMCAVLLLSTFVSCGGGKDNNAESTPDSSAESKNDVVETDPEDTARYDANGYLMDDLPETYDWQKKDFTVYTWQEMAKWEWCEEMTENSGTVDLALYKRMQAIETRFNMNFVITTEKGNWDNRVNFVNKLYNNVSTNQSAYDLVGQYTQSAGGAATREIYFDLNEISYLDLEKPWWPSAISETATIGDKLYFATGDITPTLIRNVHCMYVNEDIYEAENIGDSFGKGRAMYDVVKDGDWTLELLMKMGIDTVSDAGDKVGITFANLVSADAFFYGAGFSLIDNDNGILSISDDLVSASLINVYDNVQKMYSGQYGDVKLEEDKSHSFKFKEGDSLFYAGTVADAQLLTEKGINFTILPMPMRDVDQEGGYKTVANFWVTYYSIPIDAPDTEFSGMIMEALASEAYRNVTDVIYYDVFSSRYMTGESAELLDIVSKSVVFDTGRMFPEYIGSIWSAFRNGVSGSDAWTTIYEKDSGNWSIKIDSLYTLLG